MDGVATNPSEKSAQLPFFLIQWLNYRGVSPVDVE